MNNSANTFATYQAAYALGSLVYLWSTAVDEGKLCVAVLIAMTTLSILAARMLWFEKPAGWLLSAIVQGIQSIGIYLPVLAVQLTMGFTCGGHVFFFQKTTFGESIFNSGHRRKLFTRVCSCSASRIGCTSNLWVQH
jgi:hypothetical protein